jgi:hypothetical protein
MAEANAFSGLAPERPQIGVMNREGDIDEDEVPVVSGCSIHPIFGSVS